MVSQRVCTACRSAFLPRDSFQFCCSVRCGDGVDVHDVKRRLKAKHLGLSTSTVGAANELLVAADLMLQGWQVFRAISPHCMCDLIAAKHNLNLRIEVKTGIRNARGKMLYPKGDSTRFDVIAVVLVDEVVYIPALPD